MKKFSGIIETKNLKKGIIFLFFVSAFLLRIVSAAEIPADLKDAIDAKSKSLQEINQKMAEAQKNLETVTTTDKKIQTELKKTDTQINYLNLSIKGSQINIEKLGLEIQSIGYDISKIKSQMTVQRAGMKQFLKEIQSQDNEGLLITFLKNRSLSEGMDEFKNITDLNERLAIDTQKLEKLGNDLSDKLDQTSQKKSTIVQENKNLTYRKTIVAEEKQSKEKLLAETKNQEKIYQQQLAELKKTQDEISNEINDIEIELRKTIDKNFLPTPRHGVLLWPVNGGTMTQGYGRTPFAITHYSTKWHDAVDIGAPIGTELFAAEDGEVINVGNQDAFRGCKGAAYGKFVVIKHNNGLTTLYGHLSKYIVSIGQKVSRGEVIGYMGSTGNSTGSHVHFTVFASQTLTPAHSGLPEGAKQSRVCGPMPVGGDLDPTNYL